MLLASNPRQNNRSSARWAGRGSESVSLQPRKGRRWFHAFMSEVRKRNFQDAVVCSQGDFYSIVITTICHPNRDRAEHPSAAHARHFLTSGPPYPDHRVTPETLLPTLSSVTTMPTNPDLLAGLPPDVWTSIFFLVDIRGLLSLRQVSCPLILPLSASLRRILC